MEPETSNVGYLDFLGSTCFCHVLSAVLVQRIQGAFLSIEGPEEPPTVDSNKLEYGFRVMYAGFPSFFGLRLEDNHVLALLGCSLAVSNKHRDFRSSLQAVRCGRRRVFAPSGPHEA